MPTRAINCTSSRILARPRPPPHGTWQLRRASAGLQVHDTACVYTVPRRRARGIARGAPRRPRVSAAHRSGSGATNTCTACIVARVRPLTGQHQGSRGLSSSCDHATITHPHQSAPGVKAHVSRRQPPGQRISPCSPCTQIRDLTHRSHAMRDARCAPWHTLAHRSTRTMHAGRASERALPQRCSRTTNAHQFAHTNHRQYWACVERCA